MSHPIVVLWAVPRSTSTAFELMMRQRGDMLCFHEPFGEVWHCGDDDRCPPAHRFDDRPGLSLASTWADLLAAAENGPVFVKDFPHHVMPMVGEAFIDRITHSFLVRDPAKALSSLHRQWPDFVVEESGFPAQRELFDQVTAQTGRTPPVIDSDDLLDDPAGVVAAWCGSVGLPFVPDALSWPEGTTIEAGWYDGAPWHRELSASTGLTRSVSRSAAVDDPAVRSALAVVRPHYDRLHSRRLMSAR